MPAVVNIIVAAVLAGRAWKAAHRWDGGLSPGEHLLIFLLMTGMFQTGGFSVLGINLSAWRLLIWFILVWFVLLASGPKMWRLTAADLPIVVYGAFLLWCGYRLAAAPSVTYGMRSLLKLVYPFMVLLLARKVARPGHLGVYAVPMIGASLIISIFTSGISENIPYLVYNPILWGVFWPRATFADHAAIVVGVSLVVLWAYQGCVPASSRRLYILGIVWLILSPLVVASRTGLLATVAAISGYTVARFRAKALPAVGGLALFSAAAFVFVPELRTNTFYDPGDVELNDVLKGDVDLENVDSSGRFALWEELMDRFYYPDPWMGSGIGSVQEHLYTLAELHGGLRVAHSDYVTLLCDVGLVGLLLYLSAAVSVLGLAGKCVFSGATAELRAGAALVLASFLASLCAAGFDNVFNYTLPVHSLPFAFTGILLGIMHNSPSFAVADPWLWCREHIWVRWLFWRRRHTQSGPERPSTTFRLYA